MPSALYAIGDVHGCLAELQELERQIIADGIRFEGPKLLIMLGDYVDRGPEAAGVIDHLLAPPPPGFERICLQGNHEVMAAEFIERPHRWAQWFELGGLETLKSYGLPTAQVPAMGTRRLEQMLRAYIPEEHLDFLNSRPWTVSLPGWLFVHAGVKPGVSLEDQSPSDLHWIREEFLGANNAYPDRVVHGHTPTSAPEVTPGRIGLDTGAFATGVLSAVRITPDGSTSFLQTA
ncbi:metallophosphoesterase family protein [uncultured Devosia sp.]|uniref:metallophosphoesterase family protein n=1 Tax=uncultured Devosia sp. TaxID=211434 RepID=UPI00261E72D0|nr:metallophosphoesterase family protein [uncultured Devosia sp.]